MKEIYSEECLYKDTYTIINMMDYSLKSKINPKFIQFLEENQDKNYISCIDTKTPLKDQELREEIKLMLSIIYINYLCSSSEKEEIQKEENRNIKQYNKELYDNMFEKKVETNNQLVVIEKKNIIQKIIDKIKTIFESRAN